MTVIIWSLRSFIRSINFFMKLQQLIYSHLVIMFLTIIYLNTVTLLK